MGNTEVCTVLNHSSLQLLGVGRSHTIVNVGAVGIYGQSNHLSAQSFKSCGRSCVGCTICAVQNNLHAGQGLILGEGRNQVLHVSFGAILQRLDGTHGTASRVTEGLLTVDALDSVLNGVLQLLATTSQKLNTVVCSGVVRCRNHHAKVSTGVRNQVGCCGSGNNTRIQHIYAGACEACLHRRHNKVSR